MPEAKRSTQTNFGKSKFPYEGLKNGNGESMLHCATKANHLEMIKYMIDMKCDPNCRDNRQQTPLHVAANIGNDQIVLILLEAGSTPNLQDSDGNTALHTAVANNNETIVKLLVKSGWKSDVENVNKATPLSLCNNEEIKKAFQN